MSQPQYAWLGGRVVKWDEARIHVASVAFKYGTSVFEGIRAYWNAEEQQLYLLQLEEHLERLAYSQLFMRFKEAYAPAAVASAILELVRANQYRENVHVTASVYVSGLGQPPTCGPIDLAVTAAPRSDYAGLKGVNVQISSWRRVADDAMPMRVKCNANYQNGRIAALQALEDGYDTALLLNQRGKISEGPAMCFFAMIGGKMVTPSRTNDILESITRQTVITLLKNEMGITVEERDIDRSELVGISEAFFCGTAWEVTPVHSIDRYAVGGGVTGPLVTRLATLFAEMAQGRMEKYRHWLTPVYPVSGGL